MPTEICRHIKTNGARCGSPSLNGNVFCYFHNNASRRHQALRPFDDEPAILHPIPKNHLDRAQREPLLAEYYGLHPRSGPVELDLPPLEDPESIQLALSMVISAMARNRIDTKHATPILYGLQLASANSRHLNHSPSRSRIVRETVLNPNGLEIAPDEDNEAELDYQAFLEGFLANEAAEDAAAAEDNEDNE